MHYCGLTKFVQDWYIRKLEDENDNIITKDLRWKNNVNIR